MNKPQHHIFICSSSRINGQQTGFCISKNSAAIIACFMEEIADRDLEDSVMVTNTGCLSICNQGPIVIIYPQGTWYGKVCEDDVEEIMDALENEDIVERLVL